MNLRKFLYLLNAEQTQILHADVELISKRCTGVGGTERKEQTENQKSRDSRCPKCRATSDKIVDRIAQVEGTSNFRGNIFKFVGRLAIETKPVNHCNKCNHEWEKFRTKIITDFQITKVILDYLSEVVRDPEGQKRYSWKLEAIEIFEGCHAESILMVQKKHKSSLHHPLTIKQLRKNYKSVFDKKENTS